MRKMKLIFWCICLYMRGACVGGCVRACVRAREGGGGRERRLLTYTECLSTKERVALLWRDPFILIGVPRIRKKCECNRLITADLCINTFLRRTHKILNRSTRREQRGDIYTVTHTLSLFPEVIDRVVIKHSAHFLLLSTKHWSSLLRNYSANKHYVFKDALYIFF